MRRAKTELKGGFEVSGYLFEWHRRGGLHIEKV